jgi:hypothetical protein
MASEIALVPVDEPEVSEEIVESAVLPDEALPERRARGRPAGSKNKAKPVPAAVPPPVPTKQPKRKPPPPPPPQEESEEEEEEEEASPVPAPKRAPKKRAVIAAPLSPRSRRLKAHVETQNRRRDYHEDRVHGFSTMLDGMLGY